MACGAHVLHTFVDTILGFFLLPYGRVGTFVEQVFQFGTSGELARRDALKISVYLINLVNWGTFGSWKGQIENRIADMAEILLLFMVDLMSIRGQTSPEHMSKFFLCNIIKIVRCCMQKIKLYPIKLGKNYIESFCLKLFVEMLFKKNCASYYKKIKMKTVLDIIYRKILLMWNNS